MSNQLFRALKISSVFIALVVGYYLVITTPTWWAKLALKIMPPGAPALRTFSTVAPASSASGTGQSTGTQVESVSVPTNLTPNHLVIPALGVNAPVNWEVATDDQSVLSALKTGVAQFKGSALPPQNGNVFISGHSSYYWWDKGSYHTIFANLPVLKNGDKIYLDYRGGAYVYQVFNSLTVAPSQTDVLKPTGQPTLSLMTCVPVGTAYKRLVVQAKRIYPSASTPAPSTPFELQKLPVAL